jgi:hypothetical protein
VGVAWASRKDGGTCGGGVGRLVANGGGAAGWCGGGARGEVRRWTAMGRVSVGFFSFRGNSGMAGPLRVKRDQPKIDGPRGRRADARVKRRINFF